MQVLVLGATGYIGGRLVPELVERGHQVRCGARTPSKLDDREWRDQVEVVELDVFDPSTLEEAMRGCDAVHFLVHSMDGEDDFAERDRQAAANVRDVAARVGVDRIVYLGGLGRDDDELSDHLRSRHEVGWVLAEGAVPVTELRAAIIVGSGSASFEMLRHLCEVLPVMTTPRWVDTKVQPIAVRDVVHYLAEVLEVPETTGRVLEIGGPDVLTYRGLLHTYAEMAGLRRRLIVPVPVLTPRLSSHWIGLVTPLPTGLAKPLVDSLVNEVVVEDHAIDDLIPRDTLPLRDAITASLERRHDLDADGDTPPPEDPRGEDPAWSGGTLPPDERRGASSASPVLLRAASLLAAGLPSDAQVGSLAGRWQVRSVSPTGWCAHVDVPLPGDLWIDTEVIDEGGQRALVQRARFAPRGLGGRLAWAALAPVRAGLLAGSVRRRTAAADRAAARG